MTEKIYGVDPNQELTPLMIRDAVVECFFQAHCLDSGLEDSTGDSSHLYCKQIVKKAFADSGFDFDQPTKPAILAALENLKGFAANFRDQKIITEHYGKIMQLVNKLK